jgi:hypothetical protein
MGKLTPEDYAGRTPQARSELALMARANILQ